MTDTWQNRIVGYKVKRADELTIHPDNARKHPQYQRDAVEASLDTLGWIAPVIENVRSGYVVDGNERSWQALGRGDDTQIPVIEVDLSPEEESQALATFDFITYLAQYDKDGLKNLLSQFNSDNAVIQQLAASMSDDNLQALINSVSGQVQPLDTWDDAFDSLPDSDRAPFQQKTFTLHDNQVEIVENAIRLANSLNNYDDTQNENSNGNALTKICEAYIESYG